jgi:DNA repair protein RecN (Recombination protein N)
MLRFLDVRHLAVIDRLDVELEPGLTALTGETGAGKSVIVEAIDLLLGGRASADLVRTGEKQAVVQAIFERPSGAEVLVRREVSAQGRSRAFIDEALATTGALRELAASLIDLHGQHEHQQLLDPSEHVVLLDAFAGLDERTDALGRLFDDWRAAAAALDRTRLDDREKQARLDMARFQLQEIDKVAPRAGEDEELAAERVVLANVDRLSRLSAEAYDALYEGEAAVMAVLAGVWRRLEELRVLDARFGAHLDERDEVKTRLEDLALFLRDYQAGLDASPERLQAVEDRLAAIERLKRRFGPDVGAVIARRADLAAEIAALDAGEELAARLEADERAARDRFVAVAREISQARSRAARALGAALAEDLAALAMPRSEVDVRLEELAPDDWHRRGIDRVEFYISPNPGEDLRPLARIASGGELSRVMLALRTLGRVDQPGRTLVFDEVDAGIGGEAADAVGARLQALARDYQVICITHLPQIAARAATHLAVAKHLHDNRTVTSVARLDASGREQELARMIAGARVTAKVLASAQEMLRTRQVGEVNTKGEGPTQARKAKAKGQRGA